MPNGQVPVVDIVDLVLYSLRVELSLFFFVFICRILVCCSFVTTLLGEVGEI